MQCDLSADELCVNDLIRLFNVQFCRSEQTILVSGGKEPIYLPSDNENACHRIIFREDYFSSALHEISHWCIAGPQRRQQVDFGYWYVPDGRNAVQQKYFTQVEVKPQALEWILSQAAGKRFFVSSDNLSGELGDLCSFKDAIYEQVQCYLHEGLPERASILTDVMARYYQRTPFLFPKFFQREAI